MEFGVCMLTKIDDASYIEHAERLGFDCAWIADSQMIWSDCYATLALVAERTSSIRIGTGVAIAGTRTAPVTAHSIASVHRLAPGRTFLGIGAGNTALRLMDHKPLNVREFGEYLRVVRALLDGKEVDYTFRGRTAPIRLMMEEQGFVQLEPRIPMLVSGFGPKSQALAGELGDGLILSVPPDGRFVDRAFANVQAGAARVGRVLDPDSYPLSSLTMVALQDPGEPLDSERIVRECGPFVTSGLHYLYDQCRQFGKEPPPHVREIWPELCAQIEATDERRRHLRIHAGHSTWVLPEEEKFVTPELIRAVCLAGTADEVCEQVQRLRDAGLRQLVVLPGLEGRYEFLERFAQRVMSRF